MLSTKLTIYSTLIYVISIFPITALWHVVLFQKQYLDCGYFNGEESLLAGIAGLTNILVQGVILSVLFSHSQFSGSPIERGVQFSGLIGIFYFTLQVVNFCVRKEINNLPWFVAMEAMYMLIEFPLYGVLLGLVEIHTRRETLSCLRSTLLVNHTGIIGSHDKLFAIASSTWLHVCLPRECLRT